jgi:hypothetical protein
VPDLDILAKGIPSCFHVAYRLLRGGAPDDEVVRAIGRGLAQALRQGWGIPGLSERAEFICLAASGVMTREEAIRKSRELVLIESGSRHAQVAHHAMSRLVVAASSVAIADVDQASAILATAFCHDLVDNQLLGRARPDVIGTLYPNVEECDAAQARLHSFLERAVGAMVDQLTVDPSGRTVQAPPTPRATRQSTAEILDEIVG